MNSFQYCSSAEAVSGLLDLVDAPAPIVDLTYGNGAFWNGSGRQVIGCDLDAGRAKDVRVDFFRLPFSDRGVPTVIFDPPFHPAVGSAEEVRFKAMGKNDVEMKAGFLASLAEAWRITQCFLLLKCQGFVHNHKPQWMPLWAASVCGEPFEWLIAGREHKRISGRWVSNNSLRRNHADYMLFSRRGNLR